VRELENCIKRATILCEGAHIDIADLGLPLVDARERSLDLRHCRELAEHQVIVMALARADGNMAKAAQLLGISRRTLYDLISRYGICI
jgi:two-component system NtrC family response regulator